MYVYNLRPYEYFSHTRTCPLNRAFKEGSRSTNAGGTIKDTWYHSQLLSFHQSRGRRLGMQGITLRSNTVSNKAGYRIIGSSAK